MQTVDKFNYLFIPYLIYACTSHWRHKSSFCTFNDSLTQNGWSWKGPLEVIWSIPSAQAGSFRVSYTMSKWLLNVFKDGDFTISLANTCQCSATFRVEKCFLMFRWHLQYFSFCPLLLLLSLFTTEKVLAPPSLHLPLSINLLFSRMNSPKSPGLSSQERCSHSSVMFVVLHWTLSGVSMSFLYWGPQNWIQHSK